MRNFPYTGGGSLPYTGGGSFRHPEVVDVDCRVVDATPTKVDLSVPIFRFLTVTPCLLSMLGGVLDLWSGPASMIGASVSLLALVGLNCWLDPSRLRPILGHVIGVAVLAVLFSVHLWRGA